MAELKVCVVCNAEKQLADFYKNKTYASGYTSKCKECHKAQQRKGYVRYAVKRKQAMKDWVERNRGASTAIKAKYRASLRNAAVDWADAQYIKDLYDNAKEASEIFNVEFQVDHIVPLQAVEASGLHNEFNLQILTKSENCSKQNRMETHYG